MIPDRHVHVFVGDEARTDPDDRNAAAHIPPAVCRCPRHGRLKAPATLGHDQVVAAIIPRASTLGMLFAEAQKQAAFPSSSAFPMYHALV
jgi:hypothetical protein